MKTKLILCMIACCLFVACGSNSSRSFSLFGNDEPEVMCPMCGGTGIFSYMPGDIMAPKEKCSGCNGTGKMPQSKAAKLQQDINTINNMFGGGSGGGGNYNGGSGGGGGRDYTECPICHGNGKCSMCAGRGEYRYEGMYGQPGGIMDCSQCHGSGRCQSCYGSGRL